jgi:carboxymethylenebutenolidase
VRRVISALPPDQITADLKAVVAHVTALPAANGKAAVAGFCWGGSQTFRFATNHREIKAAFPFYGSGPDSADDIARIQCPVFGFYGGNDARVNATIPRSTELMKAAMKVYEPVTYEGAGHGFMRAGEAPDANEPTRKPGPKPGSVGRTSFVSSETTGPPDPNHRPPHAITGLFDLPSA